MLFENYEENITKAWQHGKEIKKEFDSLMSKDPYSDLIIDKLSDKWKVDIEIIKAILEEIEGPKNE